MRVITPTDDCLTTTPNAVMTSLATPSLGTTELSTWKVHMEPGSSGPPHSMDREQVWTPLSGAITITVDDRTETVTVGQTAILPSGAIRRISAPEGPAEALVCMVSGGQATLPESGETRRVPWAE